MDSYFQYYKSAAGKNFIGRETDLNILTNLLNQGENVVIYEPAKTGKRSLIQQCMLKMRSNSPAFSVVEVDFTNLRSSAVIASAMASALLRSLNKGPAELERLIGDFLGDAGWRFDADRYAMEEDFVQPAAELGADALAAVFTLPYRMQPDGSRMFFILNEFQDVELCGDPDDFCLVFEQALKTVPQEIRKRASYIFVGSRVNAMKYFFEKKKFFYRQVERVSLTDIDKKDIIEYVQKGYLSSGKVIQKELVLGACELFRNNIFYILQLNAIGDAMSRGYINETILVDALSALISINESRFRMTMADLTGYQVNLLRAMVDGHKKFSSSSVIRQYGLNSSANVHRLKDALMKKEILTFDENDEPHMLDPLFEHWIITTYFKIKR